MVNGIGVVSLLLFGPEIQSKSYSNPVGIKIMKSFFLHSKKLRFEIKKSKPKLALLLCC